ncbi:MAG: hypothetical protein FD145_1203 [Candidatus Saganbacteria bacterium]|uniref:NAD/GMP synthase domain-containing protein n=1 Tax=Candidatus Saganbacteria bacterium TaxID=2575572 RepID=A0A833L099_UNCSA|nr:MAG: hypothetical protein FD145_1203 [Candidatus Saganbacteria bacterium]
MTKAEILKNILKDFKKVLVAYSGGVDSTFLLKTSIDVLGAENVLAVIASSETYPKSEKDSAEKLCRNLSANFMVIETQEINDRRFKSNPKDRCYYCKLELFSKLKDIAKENNIAYVIDGSNADDVKDYRPGTKAKSELGIKSPLQEAGLTKSEIRKLSKDLGLPTWDKPSYACLASRIPYGTEIEIETLDKIDKAEIFLRDLGFKQLRVRHHGKLARIELLKEDIPKVLQKEYMDKINKYFEALGYIFTTIDLKGYRIGSLNEVLNT